MFTVCRKHVAKTLFNVIPAENTMVRKRENENRGCVLRCWHDSSVDVRTHYIKFPISTIITKAVTEMEEGFRKKKEENMMAIPNKKHLIYIYMKCYNDSFG